MAEQKTCVIVDAYSAGNLLAPEFRERGLRCVHVQSTPEIWPIFLPSFKRGDFEANLKFDGDLKRLVDELRRIRPSVILAGTETGVELADRLAEALALPGNGTAKSAARRNKYLMIEACRDAGLPVALQCKSASAEELGRWYDEVARREGITKVVVKPIESAGTDGVAVCTSRAKVEEAARAIVGRTNMLGLANSEALAQEFLEGTEYFLNTVSLDGHAHFTDIWRYQKRSINGADCVYDMNVLCQPEGPVERELQEYVRGVLRALDVRFGPAHTEVMMTPKGPRLVEIGTRLDGLSVPAFNRAAVGYSPVELTADAFLEPTRFRATAARPYPILKHARTVYFTTYAEGEVVALPGEDKTKALPSFFQMRLRVQPGGKVKKTTNYFTAPGFVSLAHENPAILEDDYASIRRWEREPGGFFTFT